MGYVGDAVKGVLQDVGTSYTIQRDGGNVSGEYLLSQSNTQVTKPFIREYFLEACLSYDSAVVAGDVVEFDILSQPYLVMNRTSEVLENAEILYDTVLYKANVSGELQRFSGEGWGTNYKYQGSAVQTIKSGCYGLLTEKLFGTDLATDEELGQIGIESQVLYLPSAYGAQPLDRYQAVSGEFYKIEVVESRKFDSVDVCHVAEDTRQY